MVKLVDHSAFQNMDSLLSSLARSCSELLRSFTSDHRTGCKNVSLHLIFCLVLSLLLGALLFMGLLLSLQYSLLICIVVSACTILLVTSMLFISQRVRCFVLLFLVSCALQQGRNFLLATGMGLVLLWNVSNTFQNLYRVAQSIMCNLRRQVDLPDVPSSPLQTQVNMIRDACERMQNFAEFGVVNFEVSTRVSGYAESEEAQEKLQEATQMLNATAEMAEAVYDTVIGIGNKVAPGIGVLTLALTTILFMKMFWRNKRYQNSYITPEFVRYDEQQKAKGKPHVLPLTKKEAKRYPPIPSVRLTLSDGRSILQFFVPVVIHLLTWSALIGLDALLYWIVQTVNRHFSQFRPIRVPLKILINVSMQHRQTRESAVWKYCTLHTDSLKSNGPQWISGIILGYYYISTVLICSVCKNVIVAGYEMAIHLRCFEIYIA